MYKYDKINKYWNGPGTRAWHGLEGLFREGGPARRREAQHVLLFTSTPSRCGELLYDNSTVSFRIQFLPAPFKRKLNQHRYGVLIIIIII